MAKAIRETLKSTKARSKSMANVSAMSPIKQKPYLEAWKNRLQKPIANVFEKNIQTRISLTHAWSSDLLHESEADSQRIHGSESTERFSERTQAFDPEIGFIDPWMVP